MIIQQIAIGLKKHDWGTVVLEVAIVVVGIFIGLQVDDWNQRRLDRIQEILYIERLHAEVLVALDSKVTATNYRNGVLSLLLELVNTLGRSDEPELVNSEQCNAIYESHIYVDPTFELPTLTELLSSGKLSIVTDDDLRGRLADYAMQLGASKAGIFELQLGAAYMAQTFPEIITMPLNSSNLRHLGLTGLGCDVSSMRESEAFKNNLVSNAHRMMYYVENMRKELALLREIHLLTDTKLGISHAPD